MTFIDTNVIVFLSSGQFDRFSDAVIETLENEDIWISPMVELELSYLYDLGKANHSPEFHISRMKSSIQARIDDVPFSLLVENAKKIKWTRDPFDLMITAHAIIHDADLITIDRNIRKNYAKALW